MLRSLLFAACLVTLSAASGSAQDRDTKVRNDLERFTQDDSWIYNDLEAARREAGELDKPLLVVIRCVP